MTVTEQQSTEDRSGAAPPIRPAPAEVVAFLYHEARLLDERRYEDWVSLFADEGLYWMPCDGNDGDPADRVTIVYDDVDALRSRIGRLDSGKQYAQDPPSTMCRAVSNIYVADGDAVGDGELRVHSTLVAVEARRHHTKRVYGAHVTHVLRTVGSGFAIVQKRVNLVDSDQYFENLTFLL